VKRFRGGLVFKAHRLLYHSALGLRVINKKKEGWGQGLGVTGYGLGIGAMVCGLWVMVYGSWVMGQG